MGLHRSGIGDTFQGQFPVKDTGEDGFAGIASMKSFPPIATASTTWWQYLATVPRIGLSPIILNNLPMLAASPEIRKARKFPSIPSSQACKNACRKAARSNVLTSKRCLRCIAAFKRANTNAGFAAAKARGVKLGRPVKIEAYRDDVARLRTQGRTGRAIAK